MTNGTYTGTHIQGRKPGNVALELRQIDAFDPGYNKPGTRLQKRANSNLRYAAGKYPRNVIASHRGRRRHRTIIELKKKKRAGTAVIYSLE